MTIDSEDKDTDVEVGSKWIVGNSYHLAITDKLLEAGEVEVYRISGDEHGDEITITVIYGEGETDSFDIDLFLKLFVRKRHVTKARYNPPIMINDSQELAFMPMQNDEATERLIDNLNRYRSKFNKSMAYDYSTQGKTVAYLVCTTCGKFICALKDAKKETVEKARAGNYECGHCAIVTNHKNRKTGFQPEQFLFDELSLMQKMEKKPVGKLDAFLNKEPLGKNIFVLCFMSLLLLAILIPLFLKDPTVLAIGLQVTVWAIMILMFNVDIIRMKNKFNRMTEDL